MLDVARTYYTPAEIEAFVDVLADAGGTFLHLHLSDDQNVGIESAVLGQTLDSASVDDAELDDPVYGFTGSSIWKYMSSYCEMATARVSCAQLHSSRAKRGRSPSESPTKRSTCSSAA